VERERRTDASPKIAASEVDLRKSKDNGSSEPCGGSKRAAHGPSPSRILPRDERPEARPLGTIGGESG
jgi:hypothetical protein